MLVAFSHLRWGFVRQRPQHLLSRFAREMAVVFVEEPEYGFAADRLRIREDGAVKVVTPLLTGSSRRGGFGPEVNPIIAEMLEPLVPVGTDVTSWYYTPMSLGTEPASSRPGLRVYDAMDDLAGFLNAPPELPCQEARLLERADLVFTGGPTLYRSLRDRHPAVHCFPSGVEPGHFAPGGRALAPHPDLALAPRPVLGYYGVIDERLDLALLAGIADARPEWTIALIGPVAKINPKAIPARGNIVRLGQRPYDALPSLLAAFDVALMPFALNAATRSISPTKTLEYLAGGKPVVSTPITDVIDLYQGVVEIAASAEGFVAAVEAVLNRPEDATRHWRARAARLVAANDWDAIAASMLELMARARATSLAAAALTRPAVTA